MKLSRDPREAEQQVYAILLYLTTFGYIDGDFDFSEREFILEHVGRLAKEQIEASGAADQVDEKTKEQLIEQRTAHYREMFEEIDRTMELVVQAHLQKRVKVEEMMSESGRPLSGRGRRHHNQLTAQG